ncbi:hypothetical protein N7539_000589 [Penicillium diatomitis]|uniref:Uncharacterized protein n=1 Tax=Penicillium diatomitis TaxID=2819901 RepID=A0A9X0C2B5_9EURO|nr:uncharacterized protein N7539_000589 [Penicillium diatomitis]KAJ5495473.1 hypothetical protein N7539_000589 [Penicillium diatomitis]
MAARDREVDPLAVHAICLKRGTIDSIADEIYKLADWLEKVFDVTVPLVMVYLYLFSRRFLTGRLKRRQGPIFDVMLGVLV